MQTRDFLHIDDATDALIKLSKIKSVKGVNIINLVCNYYFSTIIFCLYNQKYTPELLTKIVLSD